MPPVVFFETSALIAASIREEFSGEIIKHEHYDAVKGMINFAREGRIRGVISANVEDQSKNVLEKAVTNTIEECVGEKPSTEEEYEDFAVLFDAVQRAYRNNLRAIDRMACPPEQKEVGKEEILLMYGEIFDMKPREVWTDVPEFKKLAREISKEQRQRFTKEVEEKSLIPELSDIEILSDAIFLKRKRFQDKPFFLVSIDRHFSGGGGKAWDYIPTKIKSKYQVICGFPDKILRRVEEVS